MTRTFLRFLILLLFVAHFLSCKKDSKQPSGIGSISGTVSDAVGNNISNATITLNTSPQQSVNTGNIGTYTFDSVPTGNYSISVVKQSYVSQTTQVSVSKGNNSLINFTLNAGTATLSISADTINAGSFANSPVVNIISNTAWTITSNSNWLTIPINSGKGNTQVAFNLQANIDTIKRKAQITITAGNLIRTVIIYQSFPLRIINYPNGTTTLSDSLTVMFNKPVSAVNIASNNNLCTSDLGYRFINKNTGIRFLYQCGSLGGKYPFTINAKDQDGTPYNLSFNAQFYTQKFIFNNHVSNFFLSPDNTICWLVEPVDNKVIGLQVSNLSVVKQYQLNFDIHGSAFNPQNQLLYLTSTNTSDIYALDLNTGNIVHKITLKPVTGDKRTDPYIYPVDFGFSSTGFGVVSVSDSAGIGAQWKVIDSSLGDSVFYQPGISRPTDASSSFYTNYNHTKIYSVDAYSGAWIWYVDPVNKTIKQLFAPINDRMGGIVPNRKNNDIFFPLIFEQYIYNYDNSILSKISYFSHGANADFTYLPGQDSYMYLFDNNDTFNLLDYSNAKTLLTFPVLGTSSGFGRPLTTLDGKYLLVMSNELSSLILFDTRMFALNTLNNNGTHRSDNSIFSKYIKKSFQKNKPGH